jgi:hypothetical protein
MKPVGSQVQQLRRKKNKSEPYVLLFDLPAGIAISWI